MLNLATDSGHYLPKLAHVKQIIRIRGNKSVSNDPNIKLKYDINFKKFKQH